MLSLNIIKKLLSTVVYLQSKHIVHRDIKLENIIIDSSDEYSIKVKLVDFGCACEYIPGEMMSMVCGSIFYISPGVVTENYNH